MFCIIGMIVVLGAIAGGYLMEKGNLLVLFQPAEILIIVGAAIGTMIIGNPMPALVKILKSLIGLLGSNRRTSKFYLENLQMLYDVFQFARRSGVNKLEEQVEAPDQSAIFQKYPAFLKDHHARDFVCDTLRMSISGVVGAFDLDQMMEIDMDVHRQELEAPVTALQTVADALPGLGIVAAVLGIVITMGALGGPPEEIGHKVAAALVGTFLGILLCYGFVSPMANLISKQNEAEHHYYNCLRTALIAFAKGVAPILAVEFARRSIPADYRPTFKQMEDNCKNMAAA
jgi:chemotaxis protein MotA